MSYIRLVDGLRARPHWEHDVQHHRAKLDGLAHRIFPPILEEDDVALRLYVQSDAAPRRASDSPPAERQQLSSNSATPEVDQADVPEEHTAELGPFETRLLAELASGEKHMVCVTGDIGCGKTLTIRYLLGHPIQDAPHADDHPDCTKKRLLVRMDLLNDQRLASIVREESSEESIEEYLIAEISERVEDSIYESTTMTKDEELVDFWNEQFAESRRSYFSSSVFSKLRNELRRGLPQGTDCAAASVEQRRIVSDAILKGKLLPSEKLEYFARLLGYVKRVKYYGQHACQVFVVDNIDGFDPVVQSLVLSILVSFADFSKGEFILPLRPETLARRHRNTRVVDVVKYAGASPAEVVIDRLDRFLDDPWTYFRVEEGVTRDELEKIQSFCQRARRILAQATHPVTTLLRDVSGRDVRNGLMFAQELIRLSPAVRDSEDASGERIARELIRAGSPFYSRQSQPFVENLFTTLDAAGRKRPLMKIRILRYLVQQSEHEASLDALVQELRLFGYKNIEVCAALNDLLGETRQLLRTNSRDTYTPDHITNDGQDLVRLTRMGLGYALELYAMPSYVQETMYDAVIEPENFAAPLLAEKLHDRLHLLGGFLDYLLTIDRQEVDEYLRRADIVQYKEVFPRELVTRHIIDECYQAVSKITDSVEAARAEDQSCTADGFAALQRRMASVRTRFHNVRDKATQMALT